ncbi:hypothetical protein GCM10009117_09360 [Gangjinia marincola]|uniref:HYR domain-containing protein n=1 Tax=Gangjinia marincola TaxID=578463 RepID=A0ABN1MF83_9FLAO
MKKTILFFLLLTISIGTSAQTIYVDQSVASSGDGSTWSQAFQTIQEAVDAASPNYEIRIAEGIYQPTAEIEIEIPLILRGGFPIGGGDQDIENNITQIRADADPDNLIFVIFEIQENSPVSLEGITFNTINRGITLRSELTLSSCIFENAAQEGISLREEAKKLFINGCSFNNIIGRTITSLSSDNQLEEAVIINTTFQNGSASAISIGGTNSNVNRIVIQNCSIDNYSLDSLDILRLDAALITVNDFISQNNVMLGTGNDNLSYEGELIISNAKFLNNTGLSSNQLGVFGIGNMDMSNCLFSGQESTSGSSVSAGVEAAGDIMIDNTKFLNNNIGDSFATSGVSVIDGSLTLTNCQFKNNIATGSFSHTIEISSTIPNTPSIIENCTFENNSVDSGFSAVVALRTGAQPIISNSTFMNNTGSIGGSLILAYQFGDNDITFSNNAVLNNTVAGAIIEGPRNSSGTIQVENNLFDSNVGRTLLIEDNPLFIGSGNVYRGSVTNDFDAVSTVRLRNEYYEGNSDESAFIRLEDGICDMENILMISRASNANHRLIDSRTDAQLRIDNSTFSASDFSNTNVRIDFDGNLNSRFRNSVIWSGNDLTDSGFTGDISNVNVRRSLVKGEDLPGAGNLNGTIADNAPDFINPVQNDFRMLRCSPTINAGFNDYVDETQDLNGNPRIFQSTVDMGAYELQINANSTCNTENIPVCTTLSFPSSGSTDIPTDTSISWDAVPEAIGYFVSIGTTSGSTQLLNNQEVVNATSLTLADALPENTQIFVTIIPYNGAGSPGSCSSQSFTTREENDTGTTLTLLTQNITISLDNDGNAMITAADVDAGSSSTVGGLSLTLDQTTFSCDDIGFNAVTLTGSDNSGDTTSLIAVVTVVDNLAPIVTCPGNITVTETLPYSIPNYFDTNQVTATDNCTGTFSNVVQNPNPGTSLDAGEYTITTIVTDDFGNEIECSFILMVQDALSIPENDAALQLISVYPNPVKDILTISNTSNIILERLRVLDISGRSVIEAQSVSNTMDISRLQSGNYFVMIQTEYGQVTRRIVKK